MNPIHKKICVIRLWRTRELWQVVYGKASYDEKSGCNSFTRNENGPHRYVIKTKPDSWYKDLIHSYL